MTNDSRMKEVDKAFDAGADQFISKPIEPQKLWDVIQYKLRKIAQERRKENKQNPIGKTSLKVASLVTFSVLNNL